MSPSISSRLPADLAPNATARAVQALAARGVPVIDLTESNPTRVGLEYPEHLLAPFADPRALSYEPHPLGLLSAREAVSADFLRRGLQVPPDRIALTASTSEAYALLFKLFCDPGDAVLVPRPSYPLFEHLTRLEGVMAVPYALEYHGTWRVDLQAVREAVTPRTRALLVVSPNNPTGSFLHSDDLVQLTGLCASRDLVLIGDEVFADFPLDPAPSATSVLGQSDVVTCSLGGLSKSVGLPQVKLGWIGFAGPQATLTDVFDGVRSDCRHVLVGVDAGASRRARAAQRRRRSFDRQISARIQNNLAALREQASSYPAVSVLTCEGGWSAVLQAACATEAKRRWSWSC